MVEFETIEEKEIEFDRNNFIQVTRKRAIADDGETNQFVGLTRGYFTEDGERRFRRNFAIPLDEEVVEFVAEHIPEMFDVEAEEYEEETGEDDWEDDDWDDDEWEDDSDWDDEDEEEEEDDEEPEAIY